LRRLLIVGLGLFLASAGGGKLWANYCWQYQHGSNFGEYWGNHCWDFRTPDCGLDRCEVDQCADCTGSIVGGDAYCISPRYCGKYPSCFNGC
jgi:hypothetical protein